MSKYSWDIQDLECRFFDENISISTATIRRGLFELLQAKIKASEFLLHFNPIAGSTEFDSLEPIVKVIISNM